MQRCVKRIFLQCSVAMQFRTHFRKDIYTSIFFLKFHWIGPWNNFLYLNIFFLWNENSGHLNRQDKFVDMDKVANVYSFELTQTYIRHVGRSKLTNQTRIFTQIDTQYGLYDKIDVSHDAVGYDKFFYTVRYVCHTIRYASCTKRYVSCTIRFNTLSIRFIRFLYDIKSNF